MPPVGQSVTCAIHSTVVGCATLGAEGEMPKSHVMTHHDPSKCSQCALFLNVSVILLTAEARRTPACVKTAAGRRLAMLGLLQDAS